MAVRLAEKGVRMVQLYYSQGDPWDAHADIMAHKINAKNSDQAFAAVIKDLKQRGLWKDTLVVCGSEFGRTPVREVGGMAPGVKRGRDHNPFGFTMWLAGGAVKGGTIYGATDDFGFKAIEKPVHVHDIHATILYLMGIDHTEADLSLQRPRFPADGRGRQRAARPDRVKKAGAFACLLPCLDRSRALRLAQRDQRSRYPLIQTAVMNRPSELGISPTIFSPAWLVNSQRKASFVNR